MKKSIKIHSKHKQLLLIGILSVIAITVTADYGADPKYNTETQPQLSVTTAKKNKEEKPESIRQTTFNTKQLADLTMQVRTIFAHNCYTCHGPANAKGGLRLDSKESVIKGGEAGAVIVPGDIDKSELVRRISLPRDNPDAMPPEGKGLTDDEVAVIRLWVKQGAQWIEGAETSLYKVAALEPRTPEVPPVTGDLTNPIDRFVNVYFQTNNIKWKKTVDDRLYIRRVYMDVTGLQPNPDSIDAFINDSRPDKRELLVRNLLNRNDDYAQQWLTFWNDALRNDYSGTGYITEGRSDITKWLYTSLQNNKAYNDFVKELISPAEESRGFIRGIEWRGTINASQRTEMQAAQNVSQVFLGLNLKCASCHDSFISDWKLDDAYAFANLFSDTVLEVNRCDKPTGRMAGRRILFKELGQIDSTVTTKERLQQLADYLVQPKDGRLYRTLVNRVWAQLMGRGIVEPVDMMDNEPWSQDLLDWMASDFTANGSNIKKLIFNILTSKTYQLPSTGVKEAIMITAPDYVFRGMLRRRLTAEEFTDAVSSSIEAVYPDSNIVYNLLPKDFKNYNSFPRAVLVKNDPYLTALGRPNRETVSTSRISQANLLQALELTNGDLFNNAVKKSAGKWKQKYPETDVLVKEIYRNILGRLPTKKEKSIALKMLGKNPGEESIQDFIWAMALHPEFQLIF